jgi:hypothetical protein
MLGLILGEGRVHGGGLNITPVRQGYLRSNLESFYGHLIPVIGSAREGFLLMAKRSTFPLARGVIGGVIAVSLVIMFLARRKAH